ncbi:DUF4180 domain-containing protein [Marinisporobacter balticus]|uniref:Uncharacterized protein DUF4180 n=1 Tax=Marinisporobacter balticus TaxID=2018667 RepID=A0A4V2S9P3_9FIRM|nr:DUF4180 domain-containing protein [Marinisporobacter balticus]TCO68680.1 uncharacterized protein DUF4180 [Marinisporobacter balticus]
MNIAIVGDFCAYKSKSLHDFIYECNSGNCVCFQDSIESELAAIQGKLIS